MNSEIKTKWLEALRSGKYDQGKGYLHSKNSYCCLGVLANLRDDISWIESSEETGVFCPYTTEMEESDSCLLPSEIVSWAGLNGTACVALVNLNDTVGKTFNEIADYIEVNL